MPKNQIARTRQFDGVTYHLAHVNLYKRQAEHYANVVRSKKGLARVVHGSCMAGEHKIKDCWRVYTRPLLREVII